MVDLVVLRSNQVFFVVDSKLASSEKYDVCEVIAIWKDAKSCGVPMYYWYNKDGDEVLAPKTALLGATLRHTGIPVSTNPGMRFDVDQFIRDEFGCEPL
jgi:hypothetical protein